MRCFGFTAGPMTGAGAPRHFTLSDMGSSNGTFLQIREEVPLTKTGITSASASNSSGSTWTRFRRRRMTTGDSPPVTPARKRPRAGRRRRRPPNEGFRTPPALARSESSCFARDGDVGQIRRAQRGQLPRRGPDTQVAWLARGQPQRLCGGLAGDRCSPCATGPWEGAAAGG